MPAATMQAAGQATQRVAGHHDMSGPDQQQGKLVSYLILSISCSV